MITLGLITHTFGNEFERMLASVPKSITHLCILDNTHDHKAAQSVKKLNSRFDIIILEQAKPITDFSAARNRIIDHCKTDWLLFLDSDEIFTQDDSDLSRVMEQAASAQAVAISLLRSDIFYKKKLRFGEAGRQRIVRLFQPAAVHYHGATHEQPVVKGVTLDSQLEINHYAHSSISEFITAVSGYAERVAAEKKTGFVRNIIELICFPPGKCAYNLVFKLGFLDGWRGLVYAYCMSLHSALVRIYRYEIFLEQK